MMATLFLDQSMAEPAIKEQLAETWTFSYGGELQEAQVRTDVMLVRSTDEVLDALESGETYEEAIGTSAVAFRALNHPDASLRNLGLLLAAVQQAAHWLSSPGLLALLVYKPEVFREKIHETLEKIAQTLEHDSAPNLSLEDVQALALAFDLEEELALQRTDAFTIAQEIASKLKNALAFKQNHRLVRDLADALSLAVNVEEQLTKKLAALVIKTPARDQPEGSDRLLQAFDDPMPSWLIRQARGTESWVSIKSTSQKSNLLSARASGLVARPLKGDSRAISDRLVVELRQGIPAEQAAAILEQNGLRQLQTFPFAPGLLLAGVAGRERPFDALRELLGQREHEHFALIEPVLLEPIPPRWTPPDPEYHRQWQWNNTGQSGGKTGADARLQGAWNKGRGKGMRVAIIDNGMAVNHPDLKTAIKRGGRFKSLRVGQADFAPLSAANRKDFPQKDHGTFCCGMAAARTNGVGGCGAAPEAELIAVACLEDQLTDQATLARAVAYAANPQLEDSAASLDHGADVISCSLGPSTERWQLSTPLRRAIEYASKHGRGGKGCAIFWAANNAPTNVARDQVASHPDVLAVSRSNNQDDYDGAAQGLTLAFVAPGRDVLSTTGANQFGVDSGTSYSTALAAGVGALVLAACPSMTASQLGDHLKATCDKVGTQPYQNGRNDRMGHGRINAEKAVSQAAQNQPPPTPPPPKQPKQPKPQTRAKKPTKGKAAPGKAARKRGRPGAK